MKPRHATFLLTMLLATGCNGKTASNHNLQAGLNHYLQRQEPCPGYTTTSFPIITTALSPRTDLEALASVDLVRKTSLVSDGTGQIRYDLTDKGRKSTFAGESLHAGEPNVFCFGEIEVDKITNFTEPSEVDGMHVTRVTYTRKLIHRPSWSTDPAVQKAFPSYNPAGYEDTVRTTGMILTNQGWRLPEDQTN